MNTLYATCVQDISSMPRLLPSVFIPVSYMATRGLTLGPLELTSGYTSIQISDKVIDLNGFFQSFKTLLENIFQYHLSECLSVPIFQQQDLLILSYFTAFQPWITCSHSYFNSEIAVKHSNMQSGVFCCEGSDL